MFTKKGQTIQEYLVVLGLVAAAMIAMQAYVKRGVQGSMRDLANKISSEQFEAQDTTLSNSITRSGSSTETEHLGTYTNSATETATTDYHSVTVEQ